MLALAGLIQKDTSWVILPGFGVIIGLFFSISLLADGSITAVSGGVATVIASASTAGTSSWQFISLIPQFFTIMAFVIVVYKVAKAF